MKKKSRFWGFCIVFIIVLLVIIACNAVAPQEAHAGVDTFVEVERDAWVWTYRVFYDQYTGVMYVQPSSGSFLPLYNADGTLRVYSGWQEQ